jgi:hypothetical protein
MQAIEFNFMLAICIIAKIFDMKCFLTVCLICYCAFYSNVKASALESFIKIEHLQKDDNFQILLINSNDCENCLGAIYSLDKTCSQFSHYYILVHDIRAKNLDYYVSHVLRLSESKGKFFTDDSLYQLLDPDNISMLVCFHGNSLYYQSSIKFISGHKKINFEYQVPASDSFTLEENIVPVNAEHFNVCFSPENKFALMDGELKNIIVYDLTGDQKKLIPLDSSLFKEVFLKTSGSEEAWPKALKLIRKLTLWHIPVYSFCSFINDRHKLYILESYSVPDYSHGDADIYMNKMFILTEYDTAMSPIRHYLIDETTVPNHLFDDLSGFYITGDTLFVNIVRKGTNILDKTSLFLASFKLKNGQGEFHNIDTSSHLPDFFTKNNMYIGYAVNHMFYSTALGQPIALFHRLPDFYALNDKKIYHISKPEPYKDSLDIAKNNRFDLCYCFNPPSGKFNSFVVWVKNRYFVINIDKDGHMIRRIQLLGDNDLHDGMQFFNTIDGLFAIYPSDTKNVLYKFKLNDLE